MLRRILIGFVCLAGATQAQQTTGKGSVPVPRVDSRNTYRRLIAVVPLVGSGTRADPVRPKYAPWPPATGASPTDIIGYSQILSDDGKFAIVEFVARDRAAFESILSDRSIPVFEKGKDRPDDVETALKKYRKDFTLQKYAMVMR